MADRLVIADSTTSRFHPAFIQANRPADVDDDTDTTSIVTPADLDDWTGGGGGGGAVNSVNTQTGTVVLDGADILLTGFTTGTAAALAAADTINAAFAKLQARIVALETAAATHVVGQNGVTKLWGGTASQYSGLTPATDTVYVRIP